MVIVWIIIPRRILISLKKKITWRERLEKQIGCDSSKGWERRFLSVHFLADNNAVGMRIGPQPLAVCAVMLIRRAEQTDNSIFLESAGDSIFRVCLLWGAGMSRAFSTGVWEQGHSQLTRYVYLPYLSGCIYLYRSVRVCVWTADRDRFTGIECGNKNCRLKL